MIKKRKRTPVIYMAVTSDRFELPISVGTAQQVAESLGIKKSSVQEMACKSHSNRCSGERSGYRIIKIQM